MFDDVITGAAIVAAIGTIITAGQSFLLLPYRVTKVEEEQKENAHLATEVALVKRDVQWIRQTLEQNLPPKD